MMNVLGENMDTIAREAKIGWWRLNRFWAVERIDLAKDRVLAAISDHRYGDSSEWNRFKAMEPDEWLNWLRDLTKNSY